MAATRSRYVRATLLAGVMIPTCAMAQVTAQSTGASGQPATSTATTDVPKTPVDGPSSASSGDIIVTANRRAERLQDVPLSVTALSGPTLLAQGVNNPEELGKLTPSLVNQNNAANPQGTNFAIRGVGTAAFQRSVEPSVAIVVDDVTFIRGELAVINFADVSQIEVLNGPQGFLFGKNASAGLINIKTNDPVIGQDTFRATSEYGHLDDSAGTNMFRAQVIGNISISPDLAARVNVYTVQNSALADNALPDSDLKAGLHQVGGTAKLAWKPDSDLSVLFAGDYLRSRGNGGGVATLRYVAPTSPLSSVLPAFGVTPSDNNDRSAYDGAGYYNLRVGGAQAKAIYHFDDGLTLTNILAYRGFNAKQDFDADYSPLPLVQFFGGTLTMSQISDELRLTSPVGERLEYQGGLFALHGRVRENDVLAANLGQAIPPGFTTVLGADNVQRQLLNNFAAYGQATYKIVDGLRFTAGARVTHDSVDMRYQTTTGGGVEGLYPASGPASDTRNTTNFSWRTTLQYNPVQDWMLYATAAQGYKGPGFAQFSLSYVKPEIPTHFEIGSKADLFGRKVTLNLSLFNTTFRNFQAQSVDFRTFSYLLLNAGKLRTRGAEMQFTARPTTRLTLNGGVTYTDARYLSFKGDLCYVGQVDCVNGVTDSSGRRLPNAPHWKGTVAANYEQPLSDNLALQFSASASPETGYPFLSNGDPHAYQKGYTTVDLSIALLENTRGWSLRAFARNVTNQHFVSTVQSHPLFSSDYIQNLSYDAYRQVGLTLDFNI